MADYIQQIGNVLNGMSDTQLDELVRWVLGNGRLPVGPVAGSGGSLVSLLFGQAPQLPSSFETRNQKLEFLSKDSSMDVLLSGSPMAPSSAQTLASLWRQQKSVDQQRAQATQQATQKAAEYEKYGISPPANVPSTTVEPPFDLAGAAMNAAGQQLPTATSDPAQSTFFRDLYTMAPDQALMVAKNRLMEMYDTGGYFTVDDYGDRVVSDEAGMLNQVIADLENAKKSLGGGTDNSLGWAQLAWSREKDSLDRAWQERTWNEEMGMAREQERRALMQARAQVAMQAANMLGSQYSSALQTQAQLAPYSLLPGQKYYMGHEPGGVMQQLSRMAGVAYTPREARGIPVDTMQGVNAMQGVVGQLAGMLNL